MTDLQVIQLAFILNLILYVKFLLILYSRGTRLFVLGNSLVDYISVLLIKSTQLCLSLFIST